jgi:hypothetical protein
MARSSSSQAESIHVLIDSMREAAQSETRADCASALKGLSVADCQAALDSDGSSRVVSADFMAGLRFAAAMLAAPDFDL